MNGLTLMAAGLGIGLFLIIRALIFVPTSLATSIDRLERTGLSIVDRRDCPQPSRKDALTRGLVNHLGTSTANDLVVMQRTPGSLAFEKLTLALMLGALCAGVAFALSIVGSALPIGMLLVGLVAFASIGFIAPDLTLRSQAASRRDGFRHALSSYLDLVNVLLAGGAGTETALQAAADAGDGWAFEQIRGALLRARTLHQSPWDCFSELSQTLGINELAELAASVRLAGEQGARIKLSLAVKASSLRAHQLARIEAQAQAATERMGLPTVVMFLGFMVLLGYPAMQQIVQGF